MSGESEMRHVIQHAATLLGRAIELWPQLDTAGRVMPSAYAKGVLDLLATYHTDPAPEPRPAPKTPAQHQAALLRALARHLDAHPELTPVHLTANQTGEPPHRMQIASAGDNSAPLAAWAASLGVDALSTDRHSSGAVFLRAYTEILGTAVELAAPASWLDDTDLATGDTVAVDGGWADVGEEGDGS